MQKLRSFLQNSFSFKTILLSVFLLLFSALLFLSFSLVVKPVSAQVPSTYDHKDTPFPQIHLPCDKTKDPEFNSLRPYQGAVCGDANQAYFCSNSLQFVESFDFAGKCAGQAPASGDFICKISAKDGKIDKHMLIVDLDESELPILGNTELTKNAKSGSDSIDDATKMSEYVSWYLEGTINKAEYGANDPAKIADFAGPIQKLMPGAILDAQRVKTLNLIHEKTAIVDENGLATGGKEPENHDQIVVCADHDGSGFWAGVQDVLGLGKYNPVECYKGDGSGSKGDLKMRLSSWDDSLTSNIVINAVIQGLINGLKTVYPFIPSGAIEASISNHWTQARPPLPWDDGTGKPFATDVEYQKAYAEWRGNICAIIPVINRLACFANVFVPTKYADLFPYVPLANTVDKHGAEKDFVAVIQPEGQTKITDKSYDAPFGAPLWAAHTQEVKDLSDFLNKSYTPKNFKAKGVNDTEKNDCSIVKVRSNPGDNLFPGQTHGIEVPNVEYTITEVPCKVKSQEECNTEKSPNKCAGPIGACCFKKQLSCDAEVSITLPTITSTPWAEEIWQNTVANSGSTFRRFYPKTGADSPVSCIADIPANTGVTYSAIDPVGNGAENFVVKDPTDAKTDNPQIYFPHLGSVYDYFLKGIQTALRPKGLGGSQPESSQNCTNIVCGELPTTLPKGQGSCKTGGTSSRVGKIPDSLKDIVSAAAQTYKVPPNLILAMMFGEGAFNTDAGGKYNRYNWTDQNVKNWATCQRLPNCSGPQTSIVSGLALNWTELSKQILPDLKKIDPSKKEANACNLIDEVYAIAKTLHTGAGGGVDLKGNKCFGITMSSTNPTSCSWGDDQYETAIRLYEAGSYYIPQSTSTNLACPFADGCKCLTFPGGCAAGGFNEKTICPVGDTCEQNGGSGNTSHNACVFEVGHGK